MTTDPTDPGSTVLVTGGTSQLGIFIIPRLIESGHRVIALSRGADHVPPDAANPLWLNPACLEPGTDPELRPELACVEFMISCGPLALIPRLLASSRGIRRVVAFSTSSVWVKADSDDEHERRQIQDISKGEEQFKALCTESGIDWLLLRPTLIYGCGLDRNISTLAGLICRFGWLPLAGAAGGLRQPVHADDLAQLAVEALRAQSELSFESAACGGETLTYREMVERIFTSQQKQPKIITLPENLLVALVRMFRVIKRNSGISPEMVRRQNRDLVFDDDPVRQRLAFAPRGFKPTQKDFSVPAQAARFQLRQAGGTGDRK